MVIRFIAALIMSMASIMFGLMIGGANFIVYLDLCSEIIIVFGSCFALLMCYSPAEIKTAFKHAFAKEVDNSANYTQDIILFSTLHKMLTAAAMIGLLTGLVSLLNNITDYSRIGMGLAQALLVNLYAVVLQLLFTLPCKALLEKKQSRQHRAMPVR